MPLFPHWTLNCVSPHPWASFIHLSTSHSNCIFFICLYLFLKSETFIKSQIYRFNIGFVSQHVILKKSAPHDFLIKTSRGSIKCNLPWIFGLCSLFIIKGISHKRHYTNCHTQPSCFLFIHNFCYYNFRNGCPFSPEVIFNTVSNISPFI